MFKQRSHEDRTAEAAENIRKLSFWQILVLIILFVASVLFLRASVSRVLEELTHTNSFLERITTALEAQAKTSVTTAETEAPKKQLIIVDTSESGADSLPVPDPMDTPKADP